MPEQKSVKRKGRKRDYIIRIHVGDLRNRLIMRVTATSRKEAVEATKAAIEITGEVAPLTINQKLKNMFLGEEIVAPEGSDAEVAAPEVAPEAEAPVEAPVAEEAAAESAE